MKRYKLYITGKLMLWYILKRFQNYRLFAKSTYIYVFCFLICRISHVRSVVVFLITLVIMTNINAGVVVTCQHHSCVHTATRCIQARAV